ncbi:hypothetical protein Plano_1946 [Planococcus sp. PAMC 21323]|uniref:hypothetical protein n=1 Tax=Planococcus sp. PAMC 21323 TaxID=1526927 RepID=UPI00056EA2AD|nr:hypothetical protein [Planococcus sp. PAMC 21323]AIY05911.1 hypothetical protein Plano_1946 [Planococcus sp. PAMC 21323]
MDFLLIISIVLAALIGGHIIYSPSEKRIENLEQRMRQLEKQLIQVQQGEEWIEPDINSELRQLLKKGKMVEAVKRTREEFGLSLLEAKQYVDELKDTV